VHGQLRHSEVKADHQAPRGFQQPIPRTVSSKARSPLEPLEDSIQDLLSSSHEEPVREIEQGWLVDAQLISLELALFRDASLNQQPP
jgi:hypothetical protein